MWSFFGRGPRSVKARSSNRWCIVSFHNLSHCQREDRSLFNAWLIEST
jgi:hypothetical protein